MKLKNFFLELKIFIFIIAIYQFAIQEVFSKRISEKGLDCALPFSYNGKIYTDCAYSSEALIFI